MRDRLGGLWCDEDFADWYPRDGRPGLSPAQLATVCVLDKGNYPGDLGTMEMNLHALEHITRTCVEQSIHSDQPRLMQEIAEGYSGKNSLAVFEVFKKATQAS